MKEIERKFLVNISNLDLKKYESKNITQAYMTNTENLTTRIRISNQTAYITIKGKTTGITRSEYEYEIPVEHARSMIKEFCGANVINKKRYIVPFDNKKWEIDVFEGQNKGLVLAEIELNSENEVIKLPSWVTNEVSTNKEYTNAYLVNNPFKGN